MRIHARARGGNSTVDPVVSHNPKRNAVVFTIVLLASSLLSDAYFRRRADSSVLQALDLCEMNLVNDAKFQQHTGMAIIVNSHVKSSDATNCLANNMLSRGLNNTSTVIFVLGGAAEPTEQVDRHNFTWIRVTHDAIDFNGLIWAKDNFVGHWFVYVHDTVLFGKKINSILSRLQHSEPSTRKMRRHPSMNMGTYLTTDLRRAPVNERLAYIKQISGQLNTTEMKLQGLLDEDVVFKLLSAPTMGGWKFTITNWLFRMHRRVQGKREFDRIPIDVYGSGTLRAQSYHPNLDLFKFSANYDYHRSGKVVILN